MFPIAGINPMQIKKMMQQFGIQSEELDAKKVIFELEGKRLIIEKPNVTLIEMKGQKLFNVSGELKEETDDANKQIPDDDILLVMKEANVTKDKAKRALENNNGNIAAAILSLKK